MRGPDRPRTRVTWPFAVPFPGSVISHVALVVALYSLLVAGCRSTAAQSNINGYGKTTWGMTPDQVLNAEAPEAKRIEQPDRLGDLTSAIAITAIQLGTAQFDVVFFFDSDHRLQTVR